jgi:hypothetical protein
MAIEAPLSKYKKNGVKLYALACVLFAIVFAYDGYLSKYQWAHRRSFYEKHVKEGKPDDTMMFNRVAPFVLIAIAAVLIGRLWSIKERKLLADETELIISTKEKIPYDSIERIHKTNFDSKGHFTVTYKDKAGGEVNRKISDRTYDNLAAILEHLVAKIS